MNNFIHQTSGSNKKQKKTANNNRLFLFRYRGWKLYIHLYSPERQQQQLKKSTKHTTTKTNKQKRKNYAQIGRASEQCYHIYTPTNSKNIC